MTATSPAPAALTTRRRALAATAVATTPLAALSVAACGSSSSPTRAAASCKAPVDYMSPFNVGSVNGDGLQLLNQDFAAANSGCTAQMIFGGTNAEILEKLVTQVVAGTPPAATLVPAQGTPLWIAKGVVQPLTKFAQRDKVAKDQFFDGYWPQMVIRNDLWRLPFQIDVNFPLFWNARLLRDAGVSPTTAPTTIDDLDKAAIQLTRGQAGELTQFGMIPWRMNLPNNALQTFAYAFGGDFQNADATKVTVNDPKVVQALEWMVGWARRMGGYDVVDKVVTSDPNGFIGLFAANKLAFSTLGSGEIGRARTLYPQLDLGSGLWPGVGTVKPGAATWLSGRGVGIVQGAKDPDAAWAWVKWVSSTNEGTAAAVNRMSAVPGLKSSPGLKVLEGNPDFAASIASLRTAKHTPPGGTLPIDIWGNKRDQLLVEALQQKRSARDALDECTRTAQAELDQELARQKK